MRDFRSVILASTASIVLAACGGGAATTDNPAQQIDNTGGANLYTGPVARDADVLAFQQAFWSNARTPDRCGSCHNEAVGQTPMFVRNDDVNMAYDAAVAEIDLDQPELSRLVEKVSGGHNCWVTDPGVCGSIMTTWIENWVGVGPGTGRQIILSAPASVDPTESKNFPSSPPVPQAFLDEVYTPLLTNYCSDCHNSESPNAIQPYFADATPEVAYEAAKSKINLDDPGASRLAIRLSVEFHNCWSQSCSNDGQAMADALERFANTIVPTQVDPALVYSKALRLVDGTLASGGNRYEDAQIALWEFKTGTGLTAFDTSGVDPAIDLNFSGNVEWFGGWGITINDGKAQASTTSSAKLSEVLQESGEFSVEAWVIPGNVTQEEARIISYSAGQNARNFTLQQTLYDYNFLLRTNETNLDGDPALSTPSAEEVLQATLQHVVVSYSPIDGRRIYVNGELRSQVDPVPGGTLIDWENTFALVIGNEASGDALWQGTVRLAAVHRRALSQDQVMQNYNVGVGERFYLLFDISELIAAAAESSFVLFEVQQFDSYSYLFDKPHFITLDGSTPEGITMRGMRIAMNGREAPVGQSYARLDQVLSASQFGELGQPLSELGAVLPLEKGPDSDQFFLTFDELAADSYARDPDPTLVISRTPLAPDDPARASRIGLKTFDEINATYAAVTGVDQNTMEVDMTFQELRQSLPAVEDVNTFLSSHQVAIAQLAIEYCNALIDGPSAGTYFPGFDFNGDPATELAPGVPRDRLVRPLIQNIVGNLEADPTKIGTQPSYTLVREELATFTAAGTRPDNLIDRLVAGGSSTRAISKGVCAATLGSAVTLVQ